MSIQKQEKQILLDAMQKAVDTVPESPHKTNKVAACFFGHTKNKEFFSRSSSNFHPKSLEIEIKQGKRFGKKSGYIHAELGAILKQKEGWAHGASIAITDPPCPNCMKSIDEAGITAVYIDHKGFEKDFFLRRLSDFHHMSLNIAEMSGISVFKVYRKEKKIIPILIPEESLKETKNKVIQEEELATLSIYKDEGLKEKQSIKAGKFIYLGQIPKKPKEAYKSSGKYHFGSSPLKRVLIQGLQKSWDLNKAELFLKFNPSTADLILLTHLNLENISIQEKGENKRLESSKTLLAKLKAMN